MKSKFAGLNFDSVEMLTQEEKKKVKGGYGGPVVIKNLWACSADGMTWPGVPDGYQSCLDRCNSVYRYMFCMCTYV